MRLLLLIDAVDQLRPDGQVDPLAWLPLELPANVRMLLSVVDEDLDDSPGARLRAAPPAGCCHPIGPLTVAQGIGLLTKWLQRAGRTLSDTQQRQRVERCVDQCRLPLYLRFLFEECRQWKSCDMLNAMSDDAVGIVLDFLARLEGGAAHSTALVRHVLKCLAAARYGLTEEELLSLLSGDERVMDEFAKSPESPPVVVRKYSSHRHVATPAASCPNRGLCGRTSPVRTPRCGCGLLARPLWSTRHQPRATLL